MDFAITPIVPAEAPDGLLGNQLQIRNEGVDVGDPNVLVIDFIADPAELSVTRGWGENRHVITVRKLPGPPPPPPPPVKKPGWMTDVIDSGSTPLHANSGYGSRDYVDPPGVPYISTMYAGIEDFAGETIVWTPTWTPTGSDASPTVTPIAGGKVSVAFAFFDSHEGLLVLAATVDGSPSGETIEMACGSGMYANLTWGPTP